MYNNDKNVFTLTLASKGVNYEIKGEIDCTKIELVAVEAFTQSINQLFEDREKITDPEDRALAGLKMSVARCRKKFAGKKKKKANGKYKKS